MTDEKKRFFRKVFDFVVGTDIRPDPPPIDGREIYNSLFERLILESKTQSYIRRVKSDVLLGTKLVDEIIWLMFNLQKSPGRNFLTTGALVEALDQRPLSTALRVFYVYVDEQSEIPAANYISDTFYDRLADLSEESTSLFRFLNERFRLQQLQTGTNPTIEFAPDNPNHRKLLVSLLRCQFSVCRKPFPPQGFDHIFIVGRMPLHDVQEIERYRYVLQTRNATTVNTPGQPAEVYLAVTVKTAGRHEDSGLGFNAHRFGQRDDNSPQREYNLFIGNWRTDWEFSIGGAEHDEVYHSGMASASARIKLNNLQRDGARWVYRPSTPSLPPWISLHHYDATRETGDGIRLCFVRPPTLDNPLLNVMNRRQFRQEISFIGRVLPHSQGQLQQFNEITDPAFRAAFRDLRVTAAIQIKDSLWLVNSREGASRVFLNDQSQWELANLEDGATFHIGEAEYRWQSAANDLYPQRFCGALSIYPSPREALAYKKQLNVDKDAEGFLVALNREFSLDMNPDLTLGADGVVYVKCVEVTDDGRGKYALVPVPKATNPFFAFQPVYPREKGWPSGKAWLTYDEKSGDLQRDEQTGEAGYGDLRILAEEHSYHLIGGTSLFQLKVSGTPYIGAAVVPRAVAAAPGVAGSPVKSPSTPTDDFTPTPLNIEIRLLNTPWAAYRVEEADQSNFAVHFRLLKDTGPKHFLKAYFPHSVASAKREAAFYKRYRDRAEQLYLSPPHVLQVNGEGADNPPWALVFPLLDSHEKYFPTSSQATIAQAAAVGLGMAGLLRAMADDGLINLDVDVTQLCFDSNGRMVVVDFDNTFPILTDPNNQELVAPLLGILREGRLPAKNPSLPPEARTLSTTLNPEDRRHALASIGPAFSTYMLAVILSQMLKAGTKSKTDDGYLTVPTGILLERAAAQNLKKKEIRPFEDLLREMLSPASAERPQLADVVTRLQAIIHDLSASNEKAREDSLRLLGGAL
jgi:hypothetical protein